MDLVSVIIPYFKKKLYIQECVNSVLNQTYINFEIIIIYDDNNFNDLSYIKKITSLDQRITVIVNPSNLGAGLSRNVGIKQAKGKYIAFLDADDIWKKDKIKNQISFMKNNNLQVSHTSYEIIDSNYRIISNRIARNFSGLNSLLKSCDIGLSTVLLNKEIIMEDIKFPHMNTKEDFVFWLSLLEKNIIIAGLDENLTSWRKLDNSLSSSIWQRLIDGYSVYHKHMRFNFFKSIYYLLCLCINYLLKKK
jgi:teichuronic acid biosynthesis glycosyltransferase TuaG